MPKPIYIVYYSLLVINIAIAFIRYGKLDNAMKVIATLTIISGANEIMAYVAIAGGKTELKNIIYYIYGIVEILMANYYFIILLNPKNKKLAYWLCTTIWLGINALNAILLKGYGSLNTNIIMLESLNIITLSLYAIYCMLKDSASDNIFRHTHFWMATSWVVYWSITFFFWAFIKILYKNHWQYMGPVLTGQVIVTIIIYAGTGLLMLLNNKKTTTSEHI
jgi:hypothetical protein